MTSCRRVRKESDELLCTVRSLVTVREPVASARDWTHGIFLIETFSFSKKIDTNSLYHRLKYLVIVSWQFIHVHASHTSVWTFRKFYFIRRHWISSVNYSKNTKLRDKLYNQLTIFFSFPREQQAKAYTCILKHNFVPKSKWLYRKDNFQLNRSIGVQCRTTRWKYQTL